MEEQAKVEAVQVYHYRLLLSGCPVVVSCELQIAILVKALLLPAGGDVVEDIHLRGYLAVI